MHLSGLHTKDLRASVHLECLLLPVLLHSRLQYRGLALRGDSSITLIDLYTYSETAPTPRNDFPVPIQIRTHCVEVATNRGNMSTMLREAAIR